VSPDPQPLLPADLEDCLALDRASLGGLWSRAQWRTELEEAQRPGIGLRHGGELMAMACGWLVIDELHVTLVAVAPGARRRGHGRRVLESLIAAAGARGAERATLEVAAGNAAARGLYEACGFRTAGVRRGYYRNGEDALIQWRTIELRDRCG
jgi:ribosomal-protein-alanine N-acetyltransferase